MIQNWPTLLAKFIADNKKRPFEWGAFDCCLFAADAVQIITGKDYAESFRGRYKSKSGATKAIRAAGFESLSDVLCGLLGEAKTGINIQRGAVCLVDSQQGPAAGIFFGGVVWTTGPEGLVALPLNKVLCFWSIEECRQ